MLRALRSQGQPLSRLSEAAQVSIGTVHSLTRPSVIGSAGYEGRTVEQLTNALAEAGVATLVDVRENAISRKAGLSKRALAARCAEKGIDYRHEPALGNPQSNRDGFREGTEASIQRYEAHLREHGVEALDRVAQLLKDRTVALLCFEADPCSCHRSIVAKHLQERDPLATVREV
jgi:uncharacterized protein (DUF488 family)